MARPPLRSAYIYLLLALTGYMVADLTIISFRDDMIPKQAPPARPRQQRGNDFVPADRYAVIKSKNMFNLDGKIPPPIGSKDNQPAELDLPPQKTSLPGLVLIGTLVHSNPNKSVASVKTANSGENVGAFRVGETIDNVGEVLNIERGKVIFRNVMSRRKEFIELPQEGRINLGLASGKTRQDGEVVVNNDFDRSIKRDDVVRITSNLPEVLQQARAVKEGEGFRMIDIQPGSIYERLGIKRGDLIKSVNGENVDSPQKAMELYNSLKNAGSISLGIERNGRPETLNFTIN